MKTCDFDELDHTFVDGADDDRAALQESRLPLQARVSLEEAWQLLQSDPGYLLDTIDVDKFAKGLRALVSFEADSVLFAKDQVLDLIKKASVI